MDEQEQTSTLRERIIQGDDQEIRAFLLATLHVNSEEHVLAYRDIITRFERNTPFMIRQQSRYVHGFAVFASADAPESSVDLRTMRYFGKLADDIRLDVKREFLIVPTGKFFAKYDSSPWQEMTGDILVRPFDMLHYQTVLSPANPRTFSVYTGAELEKIVRHIGCPYAQS